ncbi:MAG: Rv3235 family protein [Propionibacteriales bacterium]|nr:Rv3235 family protein [Propionibacteriales bacterium]
MSIIEAAPKWRTVDEVEVRPADPRPAETAHEVEMVGPPATEIPPEMAPTRVVWPPASVVGGSSAWPVGATPASWRMHVGQPELFSPVLGELGVVADLDDWLEGFALTVLEVLSARRPARQLDVVLTMPVRLNIKRSISADAHLELVSVRGQRSGGRAIEASAHIRVGGRSVAAAFRLTHTEERWVCTAWQMRVQDLQGSSAA